MRTARLTINILLVVALLASGMPLFAPGDANRDGKVCLEDAILGVMDFARSADDSTTFATGVEKALSALTVVAGLKTSIKTANEKNTATSWQSRNVACLSVDNLVQPSADERFVISETMYLYRSIQVSPDAPPPEVSHCFSRA